MCNAVPFNDRDWDGFSGALLFDNGDDPLIDAGGVSFPERLLFIGDGSGVSVYADENGDVYRWFLPVAFKCAWVMKVLMDVLPRDIPSLEEVGFFKAS